MNTHRVGEIADGEEDEDKTTVSILHVGKYFPPYRGGMETFLHDLMIEQARQRLDVSAIVHAHEPSLRSTLEYIGERGKTQLIVRVARWFTLAFAPVSPTFALELDRLIRDQKPDILHIHMPNMSALWCLLLPRARRLSWVVHWHADVLASKHSQVLRWLYWLYRPLEKGVLRRASHIVSTSPPYIETSVPLSTHLDRCSVIPLGISEIPNAEAVTNHAPKGAALRVLFVGRLTYYKGLSYLIHAVAGLDDVELRIVGTGEEGDSLKRLANRLEAGARVVFLGSLSDNDVAVELSDCDCLCLPSIERTEAFGMVLLEAMRAGRATLATRVAGSGMGWVVSDGESGLLVDPENDLAIRAALETLRDNPSTCSRMGAAGQKRFIENFTMRTISERLASRYRTCLAENHL